MVMQPSILVLVLDDGWFYPFSSKALSISSLSLLLDRINYDVRLLSRLGTPALGPVNVAINTAYTTPSVLGTVKF